MFKKLLLTKEIKKLSNNIFTWVIIFYIFLSKLVSDIETFNWMWRFKIAVQF